jgi:hypothetical protein
MGPQQHLGILNSYSPFTICVDGSEREMELESPTYDSCVLLDYVPNKSLTKVMHVVELDCSKIQPSFKKVGLKGFLRCEGSESQEKN